MRQSHLAVLFLVHGSLLPTSILAWLSTHSSNESPFTLSPSPKVSTFGRSTKRRSLLCSPPRGSDGSISELHAKKAWHESCQGALQNVFAAALIGGVVFMSSALVFSPNEAFAASSRNNEIVEVATTTLTSPTVQANAIKDALLPKPDTLGTMNDDNKSMEPIFLEKQQDSEQYSVLDEVWTLIDKYYIDQTFGGIPDWNKVHEKYKSLANKAKSDDARFKLLTEMVASLGDKYSRILDPAQYAAIQKYDLIGVGVTLMPDTNKNIIVGAPPIAGSEAARAGMQVGDFVTAINGISTAGKTAFDIIDQISEKPNASTVSMTIRPSNSKADAPAREMLLARSFLEVKNPISYKLSEVRPDGTRVGYIKIKEFNSLIKGNLEQALSDLEAQGANAYVLDIRQNTGGAFQSAVEISGLFMEDRIATYVVDNTGMRLPFRTTKGKLAIDTSDPVVIWIDDRSASASEVFAGSLRDNCRAVLAGDKSFGKGLIQAVYGLKNGAGLVLTVARYVTPSGTDIQGVGINPDLGGQYLPFGPLGIGSDTSKINFVDVQNRLSANACRVPNDIVASTVTSAVSN